MSDLSRRKLIKGGLAAASWGCGCRCGRNHCKKLWIDPPDHGGLWGAGETLNYASYKMLTRHSMAREFARREISKRPLENEMAPPNDAFQKLQAGGFADWRLTIDGMVARPGAFSLESIERLSIAQPDHAARVRRRLVVCGLSGLGCLCSHVLESSASNRKRNMLCTSRLILTGGTASIWAMRCIRKLILPMDEWRGVGRWATEVRCGCGCRGSLVTRA